MGKLGPQDRSPEYAVVDATAVIVERLQEEMQIARPIITPENFSDFASGKIESGSFSVAPKTPQEHELSLRVLHTACLRASDQDDPLFVEHAARRHPKTYAAVLDDFVQLTGGGGDGLDIDYQEKTLVVGLKSVAVTAGRFVFTSREPKDKEVFVPKPVSIYYDNLDVLGRSERRKEQAQFLIDAVRRGMPPVQALVLGVYVGLREDELLGNPYDYSKIGGILGSVACLPRVREGFGRLNEAKIRSVREAFRLAREGLVIAKSGRMSFDPDNYHQVVEELERLGLVRNRDLTAQGLEYTPHNMAVTPTLVLRGSTEVAQTTASASKLYGDYRDAKITELFGSYCTTDVITAYYQFEPSTGNRRIGQEKTSSIV